jgi:glutathione S-transferase
VNRSPEPGRGDAREAAPRVFDDLACHLAADAYLVTDRFTAADAYLVWALHLTRFTGLNPAPIARPSPPTSGASAPALGLAAPRRGDAAGHRRDGPPASRISVMMWIFGETISNG